ncbi:batten's disease protein Cln3 [Leucosporidium creatinivorum]|uniref:Protein BTN n=1 Tax=Leucosporidium creatinivorum TaxID=106004 RepID=A0A1Y2G1L3_9BASI|nr:batten's disease protein Cln3 [Leucosporidium creatinivorum]
MSRAPSTSTTYPPTTLQPMPVHSHTTSIRHASPPHPHKLAYGASFFCLGLLNNVLYVIILSAALDLVDKAATPKGIILFVNIAPALLVKIGWPYFVKGKVQYSKRVLSCSAISFIGILIVALSQSLLPRLSGIAIASFSSGLGEMTYLQLSTVYGSLDTPADLGGIAVGWFASGTGAAGLVGAGLWWGLRGLGVRSGLLVCSFLPLCMSLTFYLLLPSFTAMTTSPFSAYASIPELEDSLSDSDDDDEGADLVGGAAREEGYSRRAIAEAGLSKAAHLTTSEKLKLARPLVVRYMLPLFFVYLAEYAINSGVAPTLIYEVPDPVTAPVLGSIIKSLRDYYPLWQLVYQTFVFISRSSLSILHLPPIPIPYLPLPTLFQLALLLLTSLESSLGYLESTLGENGAIWITFAMIACEGLAGGSAYVNCFFWLGVDEEEGEGLLGEGKDPQRQGMEREFRIASVGFADTLGILLASLVASGLEPALCSAQVARGRTLCRQL